jgi:hypothetical protein
MASRACDTRLVDRYIGLLIILRKLSQLCNRFRVGSAIRMHLDVHVKTIKIWLLAEQKSEHTPKYDWHRLSVQWNPFHGCSESDEIVSAYAQPAHPIIFAKCKVSKNRKGTHLIRPKWTLKQKFHIPHNKKLVLRMHSHRRNVRTFCSKSKEKKIFLEYWPRSCKVGFRQKKIQNYLLHVYFEADAVWWHTHDFLSV